jgi:hypothetical protein
MKSSFAKIYAELQVDYQANRKKAHGHKFIDDPDARIGYRISDPWTYLFVAPIESDQTNSIPLEKDQSETAALKAELGRSTDTQFEHTLEKIDLYLDGSLRKAALETVKSLKLNEHRLGGISTNDGRISYALDEGILTMDDLEPFYRMSVPDQLSKMGRYVIRPRVDGTDPFFWRTLLEVFCRTYNAAAGRREEWSTERYVSLAFDLVAIKEQFFKGTRWSNRAALNKLRITEPYRTKYLEGKRWKISLDAVNGVVRKIGPMDDTLKVLARIKKAYKESFFREYEERDRHKSPKNLKSLNEVLEDVERLRKPRANLAD